jgi:lipopolysaccharide biosynthesis glycosyltransferase
MNIVTVMNYKPDPNYDKMCRIWMDRVIKHGGDNILVFYHDNKPPIDDFKNQTNLTIEKRDILPAISRPKRREGRYIKRRYNHFNARFKLPALCSLDCEFIFLDADLYVIKDLSYLWDRRKDKPFVAIDHQKLRSHRETRRSKFFNSGVQIVSDPKWYDYDAIVKSHADHGYKWRSWGTDQALLNDYCSDIGYDYTHKDIGPEWNACSGANKLRLEDGKWIGRTNNRKLGPPHSVYINHYWGTYYKPWLIDCPLHASYKDL